MAGVAELGHRRRAANEQRALVLGPELVSPAHGRERRVSAVTTSARIGVVDVATVRTEVREGRAHKGEAEQPVLRASTIEIRFKIFTSL